MEEERGVLIVDDITLNSNIEIHKFFQIKVV